jgi:hypothetical protein
MRELPPVEVTTELLDNLNDPYHCQLVLSELWTRCKQRFDEVLKMVPSEEKFSSKKLKEIGCYKNIVILWKELKTLEKRVQELSEREKRLGNQSEEFRQKVA